MSLLPLSRRVGTKYGKEGEDGREGEGRGEESRRREEKKGFGKWEETSPHCLRPGFLCCS
jgi:hypothetical protein